MKKKIGIISMQRIVNYGSFLQAYALKKVLESEGAECYFIDIKDGIQLPGNKYNHAIFNTVKRRLVNFFNLITNFKDTMSAYRFNQSLRNKFITNYYEILELNKPGLDRYDTVIIGSDEVFNCCQKSKWGFSKQLFGADINAGKVVSYAASFGNTTYSQIIKYNLEKPIHEALKNLDSISVRDSNSFSIIENITGTKPFIHLDPVLIYDFSRETGGSDTTNKDFIIIYTYAGRIKKYDERNQIIRYAKRYNKKLISIFSYYNWCDESILPDTPFDVLNYFKRAECVITDTFHGTIFSIITKKRFCTIVRDSNKEKLTDLMKRFDLTDRIVTDLDNLETTLSKPIMFNKIEHILKDERQNSLNYFKKYI